MWGCAGWLAAPMCLDADGADTFADALGRGLREGWQAASATTVRKKRS